VSDEETTEEVRSRIYDEIEDITPEKAARYRQIAEKYREDHNILPAEKFAPPVGIQEIAEAYKIDFEEENVREIAEHTVLVYFTNERILTEEIAGEEVRENPSSFVQHLQVNASRELQRTICRLYKKIHPYEWKDIERDVKETLEIPENSNFPAKPTAQGVEG
jgi:hypothetical protein